ncbi:MAG: hypothetical protein KME50_12930 [Nostoc desertorum CM1-VF14]|jgi:hypothetical protein|nr:hypothetical protein [Nostoc desertorum CM1-VF14]
MFDIASEWKQIINEYRIDEKASIPAIEPRINFTSSIIGIFATSSTSPTTWYSAGELLQLYPVGFGASGYAQGDYLKIVLNRYQVHKFSKIPFNSNKYLISFAPKFYLKDISLKVWEYVGKEPPTLESLETSIKATHQRVIAESVAIKTLLNKIQNKI